MKSSSTIVLKALAWLGALTLIGCILVLPKLFSIMQIARQEIVNEKGIQGRSSQLPNEPLGEEGSHCGGRYRLPCRPGLACSHIDNTDNATLGICERGAGSTTSTGSVQPLVDAGSCGVVRGCPTGKYCKATDPAGNGSCMTMDASAPLVTSVKIANMTMEQGWYRAAPGTSATITVETSNAIAADMYLMLKDSASVPVRAPVGSLKKGKNGQFTGVFTVNKGMTGELLIVARSTDASSSWVAAKVASTQ